MKVFLYLSVETYIGAQREISVEAERVVEGVNID
jgi:hypothetical protein